MADGATSKPADTQPAIPANLSQYVQQISPDVYKQVADFATQQNKPEILGDFVVAIAAKNMNHGNIANDMERAVVAELTAAKADPKVIKSVTDLYNAKGRAGADMTNYLELNKEATQYLETRVNTNDGKGDPAVTRLIVDAKNTMEGRNARDIASLAAIAVGNKKSNEYQLVESGGVGAQAKTDLDAAKPNAKTVEADVKANYAVDPKLADLAKAMQSMGITPSSSTTLPSGGAKPKTPDVPAKQ